jgi:hypothetical protein
MKISRICNLLTIILSLTSTAIAEPPLYFVNQQLTTAQAQSLVTAKPWLMGGVDHRPIGIYFVCRGLVWANNPQGYGVAGIQYDLTTPAGIQQLTNDLLADAQTCITNIQSVNGQGVIVWDFEGAEANWPVYIGDPKVWNTISPVIVPIAQQWFHAFLNAGLKVGVCLRADTLQMSNGIPTSQVFYAGTDQAVDNLSSKVQAAHAYGCTLFYVDGVNLNFSQSTYPATYDPYIFQQLMNLYPGDLFIPEEGGTLGPPPSGFTNSYSCSCPYEILKSPETGNPSNFIGTAVNFPDVLAAYPKAFSAICLSDGDVYDNYTQLQNSFQAGDIPLFRCWFTDAALPYLQKMHAGGLW